MQITLAVYPLSPLWPPQCTGFGVINPLNKLLFQGLSLFKLDVKICRFIRALFSAVTLSVGAIEGVCYPLSILYLSGRTLK